MLQHYQMYILIMILVNVDLAKKCQYFQKTLFWHKRHSLSFQRYKIQCNDENFSKQLIYISKIFYLKL